MIIELGHFALILALCVALVQALVPLIGAARGNLAWMAVGRNAALVQFALVALAMAALMHAYVTSDFSVVNVVREQPHRQTAALPDHRRVGEPRRIDGPVGVHARRMRRGAGFVLRQPAA